MANMFAKFSKLFKRTEEGIDRVNRWRSVLEWLPTLAGWSALSLISYIENLHWYACVLGPIVAIIFLIWVCIWAYNRFNNRNLLQPTDTQESSIQYTCSNSIKLEQISKLLGDLDNIFSEKFVRDIYRQGTNKSGTYGDYCIELEKAIATSNGLFGKENQLNIFLWQFQGELKHIKNKDLLITLTDGINIIMNLQAKYLTRFLDIKNNILQAHFSVDNVGSKFVKINEVKKIESEKSVKGQKFVPLREAILELEKSERNPEVLECLRTMAHGFEMPYDKHIAEYGFVE